MRLPSTTTLALIGGGLVLLVAGTAKATQKSMPVSRKIMATNVALARKLIAKWGGVFVRVKPDWALAIIGNESRFNPNAKNLTGGDLARGGAWGFMQMTLLTAQGVAKQLRGVAPVIDQMLAKWDGTGPGLLDPDMNIFFGMAHLNANAKVLGNDPILVVASYNRGVGAVRKMASEGKSVAQLDYVKHVVAMRDQLLSGGMA